MSRLARASALWAPAALAGSIAWRADAHGDGRLLRAAAPLVAPLFIVMLAALVVRVVEAATQKRSVLDALDVLTPSGRALAWTALAAVGGAHFFGWASLAIVGVLGFVVVPLAVTWGAFAAGGDDPWRALAVTRRFVPAAPTEGDPLAEEAVIAGARVPPGFRLFVRGGACGVESRHAVGGDASQAELTLLASLGEARRGEHLVPPLELWLQDRLGLCRTRVVRAGAAKLTVLPRPARVDRSPELTARARGVEDAAQPTTRLPTEGCFRLREYAPGDDARRIHWPRSLMAQELIVRQPDEIPPDQPSLRLILDTQLLGVDRLQTEAPRELLDALVRVWLGVGRALAQVGTRVTLVAAAPDGERTRVVTRALGAHAAGPALELGARVRWQGALPLGELLADDTVNLIVSARPRPLDVPATFIIVPEFVWTETEAALPPAPPATLPYPRGADENSLPRRRAERRRAERRRRDGALFDQLLQWSDWPALRGSLVARPRGEHVTLEAL